jgi:hypothetical protein
LQPARLGLSWAPNGVARADQLLGADRQAREGLEGELAAAAGNVRYSAGCPDGFGRGMFTRPCVPIRLPGRHPNPPTRPRARTHVHTRPQTQHASCTEQTQPHSSRFSPFRHPLSAKGWKLPALSLQPSSSEPEACFAGTARTSVPLEEDTTADTGISDPSFLLAFESMSLGFSVGWTDSETNPEPCISRPGIDGGVFQRQEVPQMNSLREG